MRLSCIPLIFGAALSVLAADRTFASYAEVKPVLDGLSDRLPAELKNPDEAKWIAWSQSHDKAIRARLQAGELDSMVNLLLFGTSFTSQPRIKPQNIANASKTGVLRARVDDLVAGLRRPGDDERLNFVRGLLRGKGIDPDAPGPAGVFIYNNLLRVIQEMGALAERAKSAESRPGLFHDRGVSLDTSIFPGFSIDQALRDLKSRGLLREGQVARVAMIGPGLDFIDKNEESSYDYYPQQTLQPFALYDSLVRLRLSKTNAVSVSIFDISSRVIDHIRHARERARKNTGYVIQLPRDTTRPWPDDLIAYWHSLGDRAGAEVAPIRPPESSVETRAVRIGPEVVLATTPMDLNIVLERLRLSEADRFDLVVGTNIFVYYDAFEQALALENVGSMLKPGGLLLTNDRFPEVPAGSMRQAGATEVQYTHDSVGWYRKR